MNTEQLLALNKVLVSSSPKMQQPTEIVIKPIARGLHGTAGKWSSTGGSYVFQRQEMITCCLLSSCLLHFRTDITFVVSPLMSLACGTAAYSILRMFCRPGYPKIDLITVADFLVHVSAEIVTSKPCLTSLFPQKDLSSPNCALSASPGMLGIIWDTGSYAHGGDVAACHGKVTSLSCSSSAPSSL